MNGSNKPVVFFGRSKSEQQSSVKFPSTIFISVMTTKHPCQLFMNLQYSKTKAQRHKEVQEMLRKFKDGQQSELKKIKLKELSPRELQWLMDSVDGDLRNFAKKHEKPRNNSKSLQQLQFGLQRKGFFDASKMDRSILKQLASMLEVGNDSMYSTEATSQVLSTLQTIHKFKNEIRVGKIIERQKEL